MYDGPVIDAADRMFAADGMCVQVAHPTGPSSRFTAIRQGIVCIGKLDRISDRVFCKERVSTASWRSI